VNQWLVACKYPSEEVCERARANSPSDARQQVLNAKAVYSDDLASWCLGTTDLISDCFWQLVKIGRISDWQMCFAPRTRSVLQNRDGLENEAELTEVKRGALHVASSPAIQGNGTICAGDTTARALYSAIAFARAEPPTPPPATPMSYISRLTACLSTAPGTGIST
jgi:hypothetical protein